MRHPGSGPQHTLSPQLSLTDGREQRGRRGSRDCILTIPRSILSSLNLPSSLPSLYPLPSLPSDHTLTSPHFLLLSSSSSGPSILSLHPASPQMIHTQVYLHASNLDTQCEGKLYLKTQGEEAAGCALGQGA